MAISKREMEIRNNRILDEAFELFAKETIESVTMQRIADAAKVGVASVFRYYPNKHDLAIAVCAKKWKEQLDYLDKERPIEFLEQINAIDRLEFFYDNFIRIFKQEKLLYVFDSNFNGYIVQQNLGASGIPVYRMATKAVEERFHWMYERAMQDHTIRTDLSEEHLKRVLLHTMMATCTHYAQDSIWEDKKDVDYSEQLLELKKILMDYATQGITRDFES